VFARIRRRPIRVDWCDSWALFAFCSLLFAFRGMFQTSEASGRSRGTHGEACHGVVLKQSDKRRRTRSSRRPYRRAKHRRRQSGLCPGTPSGGPQAPPTPLRGFLVFSRSFEVARDSLRLTPRSSLAERALPAMAYLWRLLPALSAGRSARPGGRRPRVRNRWSCRAVTLKQRVFQRRSHVFQGTCPTLSRTLSRTMSFPVPFGFSP
jgi:hypothetical protein